MKSIFLPCLAGLLLCIPNYVNAALVGGWEFDGNLNRILPTGPQIVSNSGLSYVTGLFGSAASLAGGTSVLSLGTNTTTIFSANSDMSISMWFRANQAQKQSLISLDDDGGYFNRTAIYTDATGIRAAFTNSSDQTTIVGTSTTYAGDWVHVAITKDHNNGLGQTELKLYVNGVNVSTGTVATTSNGAIDSGAIGRYHISSNASDPLQSSTALVANGSSFAGAIDRLELWNEVLTPGTIASLSVSPVPEPSAVVLAGITFTAFTVRRKLKKRKSSTKISA